MFQMKKQDKTSEKELNEMKISVRNSGRTDDHSAWENNGRISGNFNKEKILKDEIEVTELKNIT